MSTSVANSIRRATQLYRSMQEALHNGSIDETLAPDYASNAGIIGNLLVTVHRLRARLARQDKIIRKYHTTRESNLALRAENLDLRRQLAQAESMVLNKTRDWERERSQRSFLADLLDEANVDYETQAMRLFESMAAPDAAIAELRLITES